MPAYFRQSATTRRRPVPHATGLAQLRLAPEGLNSLRSLVMRISGEDFCFMRVAICADHSQFMVWLCVQHAVFERVIQTIARDLPEVEIAKILHLPRDTQKRA